ncbi:MAG: D-amino-acid transaminase [Firmicutes bacterium]|nr:D-amino-acid transaminase [Bacillota bacterium]
MAEVGNGVHGPGTVYLNGEFVPYSEAKVPAEDRGYLFGDGIYEVVRFYAGQPFGWEEHMDRWERSAAGIRLELPWRREDLLQIARELQRRNGLESAPLADFYLQATRGAAPRSHAFPAGVRPSLFALLREGQAHPEAERQEGVAVITVPDERWGRCDLKTLNLLPNVLAKQRAKDAGAYEALLVRSGGYVSEGSSSNVFAIIHGAVVTPPLQNILPGITRLTVLNIARRLRLPVYERPLTVGEILRAESAFLTGTTTEILPIRTLDGEAVGEGRRSPVLDQLQKEFAQVTGAGGGDTLCRTERI